MTGSLAYRNNEAAIIRGDVPDKYTRLLLYITGDKIIELGSAEGVLALLLARRGQAVTAIEKSEERHDAAIRLYSEWLAREHKFQAPYFLQGSILERLSVLKGHDTLVAVRMIYYLRDSIDQVFAEVAKAIPKVVLCGNKNRASRWRAGVADDLDGPHNFYASAEGMTELLKRHGYTIIETVTEGDPIVVGRMG